MGMPKLVFDIGDALQQKTGWSLWVLAGGLMDEGIPSFLK